MQQVDCTLSSSPATAEDYIALFKPRVMSLVIFTGFVGIFLAPHRLHPVMVLAALICLALGACGSAALNMALEADLDIQMARTRRRPIPRGVIHWGDAAGLGFSLSVISVVMMGLWFNLLASALLAFTILFYVCFYTMCLKRNTPQNIVIGGLSGALPPLIGWVCSGGEVTAWLPLFMVATIFLWTPPHFWALCLICDKDYRQAGVPMYPITHGPLATRRAILAYTVAVVCISMGPFFMGRAGFFYLGTALLLGAGFLVYAGRLWLKGGEGRARGAFFYSIFYLFFLFLGLMVDRVL